VSPPFDEAPTIGDGIKTVHDDHHSMSPPGLLGIWNNYDRFDRKTIPSWFLGECPQALRRPSTD
jgi:hypothetical protein